MKFLFDDASFSFEMLRTASFAMYGGADLGGVLVTVGAIAGGDEASWQPQLVEKALTSADATLVTLTSAEGAGAHIHVGALGQAHQIMFDWLDTTLTR